MVSKVRRVSAVVTAVALAMVVAIPAAFAAEDETSAGYETVLRGTNDYRELNGADRLVHSPELSAVAQAWAEQMSSDFASSDDLDQAFRHNPSLTSQVPSGWSAVGENIAMNYGVAQPYDHLLTQWRNSSGHDRNMKDTRWTHIGIGTFQDDDGLTWGVQVFARYGTPSTVPDPGHVDVDLDELSYTGTAECVVLRAEPSGDEQFRQCGTRPGNAFAFSDVAPGSYSIALLNGSGGTIFDGSPFAVASGDGERSVSLTVSAPAEYQEGESVTMSINLLPALTTEAELWYRDPGSSWRKSGTGAALVGGEGTRTLNPSGERDYQIRVGALQSNIVSLAPKAPEVTVSAPATYVPGATTTLTVTVDPASSGTAQLFYRTDGGSWREAASGVSIVDGTGSRTVRPAGVRDYRVVYSGGEDTATVSPVVPDVSVSAPAQYVPGATTTLTVTVDPASSGTAQLFYRTDGGSWREAASGVSIVDGTGSRTVRPAGVRDYRVVFAGAEDTATVSPVTPTLSITAPSSYVAGSSATLSVTLDPAQTTAAGLRYRDPGGAWRTSSVGVDIVSGSGSRTLNPSGSREYQVFVGDVYSNIVVLAPQSAPTVTVSAPATYTPGDSETLSVTVDPAQSGDGELWYRDPGKAWRQSSVGVAIVDGSGTRVLNPSGSREYRVIFDGTISNTVTLAPA